MTNPSVVFNL